MQPENITAEIKRAKMRKTLLDKLGNIHHDLCYVIDEAMEENDHVAKNDFTEIQDMLNDILTMLLYQEKQDGK